MKVRTLALLVMLLATVASVSAIGIIGAIEEDPSVYDAYALDTILDLARVNFGDGVVSSVVMDIDEVTQSDLEENIVIIVKDGRILLSVPEGSEAEAYLEQLRPWIDAYAPFIEKYSDEVIEEGIDASIDEGCIENGVGIYEKGTASGTRAGSTVVANYEDLCIGSTLSEYSCEGDVVIRTEHACPDGCSDGACRRPRSSGNGVDCDTRWVWTRSGFLCERPGVPIEQQQELITPPASCNGCVSGERCLPIGDRLPDQRTCTGEGFDCLGCMDDGTCVAEGTIVFGRTCESGVFVEPEGSEQEVPAPEDTPSEELYEQPPLLPDQPQDEERRGFFAWIGSFFSRLFGRG